MHIAVLVLQSNYYKLVGISGMLDERKSKMNVEEFEKIQGEGRRLCIQKNRAYGEKNISIFGLDGVIVRMSDKVQRLISLAYHRDFKGDGLEETVADTLIDISNYAIISIMLLQGSWEGKDTTHTPLKENNTPKEGTIIKEDKRYMGGKGNGIDDN